jgi:hypothetical protein
VGQHRCLRGAELGQDPFGEHLAELHAPLIERVDVPDRALRENAVFVERDELAERRRCQSFEQQSVGGSIALERAMWHEPVR